MPKTVFNVSAVPFMLLTTAFSRTESPTVGRKIKQYLVPLRENMPETDLCAKNELEVPSEAAPLSQKSVKPVKPIPNSVAIGDEGEALFMAWLNRVSLSFLYIKQDKTSFPTLFKASAKRPDFLILLEGIGMIAVDVKNHTANLNLNLEKDMKRTSTFEQLFRIPVWFVFVDQQNKGNSWYWISALKAFEVGASCLLGEKQEPGLRIQKSDCQHVTSGQDMSKLYTERFSSYRRIEQ
jgi:hypothetical protein